MNNRPPINTTGLKLALFIGGELLLFIFVGQVLRFMSRMVAWGSFLLVAALAMYVAYELYSGSMVEDSSQSSVGNKSKEIDESITSVKSEYTEGSLSESELEAELEQLLEDQKPREAEGAKNTEVNREFSPLPTAKEESFRLAFSISLDITRQT